jgi:hypothetical protein
MVARIRVNEHLCAERVQATLTGYEEVPVVSTVASGEFRARVRGSGQPWGRSGASASRNWRADDSDPAKTPKGMEEAIASHDDLGLGPQRTLEDAIVGGRRWGSRRGARWGQPGSQAAEPR